MVEALPVRLSYPVRSHVSNVRHGSTGGGQQRLFARAWRFLDAEPRGASPYGGPLKTTGPVAPRVEESPLPDAVPATIVRAFNPTASGRAAPGELELWVKQHCDIWLVEAERFPCTPAYLSEEIGKAQGIKPPSVGAITAVFQRWVKIGFAEIGAKPARFLKYTDDGVKLGLEGCKVRHKAKRKAAEAAAGRRIGRG